jgi:hypothetical protein
LHLHHLQRAKGTGCTRLRRPTQTQPDVGQSAQGALLFFAQGATRFGQSNRLGIRAIAGSASVDWAQAGPSELRSLMVASGETSYDNCRLIVLGDDRR